MKQIRYESTLVEQALAPEYAATLKAYLEKAHGLNDIKPLVREFERDFAAYIGVKHAIAVNSGSDALAMILRAIGIKKGDEVVIPSLTYHAVALAVVYAGGRPVLVDASRNDLNLDVEQVARAVTKRTRAIIAAHMFGRPCDVVALKELCCKKKLVLIEDVCQAESSSLDGRKLGSFGDLAAFSFSYYKPLSSCGGGGGMVVFNNEKYLPIAGWMDDWRDDPALLKLGQRFAPLYFMDLLSLRVKFAHLAKIIEARLKVKDLYEKTLAKLNDIKSFKDKAGAVSVPQNFVIYCERRDQLLEFLRANGVSAQKPYKPLHLMSSFKTRSSKRFPVSDEYYRRALHLPLYSFMSADKATIVVSLCKEFLRKSQQ
ncbi:MAG: DegT/DnrJ/EryC1/StrS family aminotransferase [Candidatus Omnitrophica bacterium]|nr:DegT/DnrJ/EryC1/StrS family aminotransferase [Candidatus Omnitrophota bacterium]